MKRAQIIFFILFLISLFGINRGYPGFHLLRVISIEMIAIIFLVKGIRSIRSRDGYEFVKFFFYSFLFVTITYFLFKLQYWSGRNYVLILLLLIFLSTFILAIKERNNVLKELFLSENIVGSFIFYISLFVLFIPHSDLIFFDEFILKSEKTFELYKCDTYNRYLSELLDENKMNRFEIYEKEMHEDGCINEYTKKQLMKTGDSLYEKEKYHQALVYYDSIIDFGFNNDEAFNNKGVILFKLNHYKEAENNLNKALIINSNNKSATFNLAKLYYETKKYKKAIDYYKAAIEIDSSYLEIYRDLAICFLKLNNRNDACEYYKRALRNGIKRDELLDKECY